MFSFKHANITFPTGVTERRAVLFCWLWKPILISFPKSSKVFIGVIIHRLPFACCLCLAPNLGALCDSKCHVDVTEGTFHYPLSSMEVFPETSRSFESGLKYTWTMFRLFGGLQAKLKSLINMS